jgi:hypothetical protein
MFFIVYTGTSIENASYDFLTEVWKQRHVRQSQYLLQIVKCEDIECCKPVRSNIREYLKDQFIPPPIPLIKTNQGINLGSIDDKNGRFLDLATRLNCNFLLDNPIKCFDKFCPSVQSRINDPTYRCEKCGGYFVTKIMQKLHKQVHIRRSENHSTSIEDLLDEENVIEEQVVEDGIYMIEDISAWFTSPFSEEPSESAP